MALWKSAVCGLYGFLEQCHLQSLLDRSSLKGGAASKGEQSVQNPFSLFSLLLSVMRSRAHVIIIPYITLCTADYSSLSKVYTYADDRRQSGDCVNHADEEEQEDGQV